MDHDHRMLEDQAQKALDLLIAIKNGHRFAAPPELHPDDALSEPTLSQIDQAMADLQKALHGIVKLKPGGRI